MADKLELKEIPVDQIEPNPWNPQDMTAQTFERLKKEISEVGFIEPLQVVQLDTGKYQIIGGEHRWNAAKDLGIQELPCAVLTGKKWKDEDLRKFVTVRLNVLKGQLDPVKFATLYDEMALKYGHEPLSDLLAFTDSKAMAKVLGGVTKELKKVLPKAMHAQLDSAAKESKSVEDLAAIVQVLFSKYGETVDQSFIVFTYGKADHLYVNMQPELKEVMDKIVAFCRATNQDINSALLPALTLWAESIPKEQPTKKQKASKALKEEDF